MEQDRKGWELNLYKGNTTTNARREYRAGNPTGSFFIKSRQSPMVGSADRDEVT
jgi:hypothetical protein